ncbi:MAG: hypothetical protein ACYC4K_08885 [Thiobacillus sp.]
MTSILRFYVVAAVAIMGGCANQPVATKASETTVSSVAKPEAATKSKESTPEGQIIGTPAKNSKFAKLKPGLTFRQVGDLIGQPDDMTRHETGKRWIPFYYGPDAQRLQVYYKNEGCLTYTGGNVFGGGGNALIRIIVDPKGGCWKP